MEQIRNQEYGGERPLFATHDLQLLLPYGIAYLEAYLSL